MGEQGLPQVSKCYSDGSRDPNEFVDSMSPGRTSSWSGSRSAPSFGSKYPEVRARSLPYAIPAMMISIATYILVISLQRSSTLPLKVSYGASILIAGVTQPAALTIVVAHGFIAYSTNRSQRDLKSWLISLTTLIPLVPLNLYWIGTYSIIHERDGCRSLCHGNYSSCYFEFRFQTMVICSARFHLGYLHIFIHNHELVVR